MVRMGWYPNGFNTLLSTLAQPPMASLLSNVLILIFISSTTSVGVISTSSSTTIGSSSISGLNCFVIFLHAFLVVRAGLRGFDFLLSTLDIYYLIIKY